MRIAYFADTQFFIALIDRRDALHDRAVQWLSRINEPIGVTEHVLWEFLNNFGDTPLRLHAADFVEQVRRSDGYVVWPADTAMFDAGVALYRGRPDKGWSLTDCISFHVMSEHGITRALSYDRHFEQAGFTALLRQPPPATS